MKCVVLLSCVIPDISDAHFDHVVLMFWIIMDIFKVSIEWRFFQDFDLLIMVSMIFERVHD